MSREDDSHVSQVLEFTDGTLSPERLEDFSKDSQPARSKVTSKSPASSFPPKVLSVPPDWES